MKEVEDLDALLADLEKPVEKVSKGKKKKESDFNVSHLAEVQTVGDLKMPCAAGNGSGKLFICFKLCKVD